MRVFLLIAAVAQVALAGSQFSVRMPFLNPAGVTYVNGPSHSALAAGPLAYGAPLGYAGAPHIVQHGAAPLGYAGPAPLGYAGPAPLGYAAAQYGPGPLVHHAAAPAHLAYAAPQAVGYAHARVPAVAAVPTVHHVQGVADVPITRVQANHGIVQKLVDVAHPATATRKFQVRRPAIQKQFYDIEERVVVRNAGSALVELEEPLSKVQKGPTVIARQQPIQQLLTPVAPLAPFFVGSTPAPFGLAPFQPAQGPFIPVGGGQQPPIVPVSPGQQQPPIAGANPGQQPPIAGANPGQQPPLVGGPGQAPLVPSTGAFQQDGQDDDSVVIENTDFAARSRSSAASPNQQRFQQQQQQIQAQQQELQARQEQLNSEIQQEMEYQSRQQQQQMQARQQQFQGQEQQQQQQEVQGRQQAQGQQQQEQQFQGQQQQEQNQFYSQFQPQLEFGYQQLQQFPSYQDQENQFYSQFQPQMDSQYQQLQQFIPQLEEQQNLARSSAPTEAIFRQAPSPRSQTPPQPQAQPQPSVDVRSNGSPLDLIPQARAGPSVVPSLRNLSPEVSQANQQRLIQLLTAQGGVTEVGFGRSGPAGAPVGDVSVRARVLSATPAPPQSEPAGERVSTRRVVVSRPIETLQEFDVIEPATKVERVAVNHPTVYKTLHHDVARVHTSVPVYGKALAHTYADAAVPVGLYHH